MFGFLLTLVAQTGLAATPGAATPGTATPSGATTIAIVGDSLGDGIYLGMKFQPELLRKNGIRLVRWSRSNVGLTRTDQFDYTGWLRDNAELGGADFCLVHVGANDLQSIPDAKNKWMRIGSDEWQRVYAARVKTFVDVLKAGKCKSIIWLLQPSFEKNKYLNQYHGMLNGLQFAGAAPGAAAAFDLATTDDDYGEDGIHFTKAYYFSLARAVIRLFDAWRPFAGAQCSSCHTPARYVPGGGIDLVPLVRRRE